MSPVRLSLATICLGLPACGGADGVGSCTVPAVYFDYDSADLALGDRRARTVAQYLKALGVSEVRLQVTSVGEEDARGTDEHSWAMDRWVRDR